MKRVGIVGYGHLGKYITDKLLADKNFTLVFVWNRSPIEDKTLDKKYVLTNLEDFKLYKVDIIIEVAHPIITENYGEMFLEHADYIVGSPTAFADEQLLEKLLSASQKYNRSIFVPCGAFWGAADIKKMSNKNTLKGLRVTMKKHPKSLILNGTLKEKLDDYCKIFCNNSDPLILYEGSVRELCPLAPNNVNTMAVGALVAQNLGFDVVQACLIADPNCTDKHLIEIEVTGPYNQNLNQNFRVNTIRSNPAMIGHVTGNQTYESFYYSILETLNLSHSNGIIVC